MAVDDDTPNDSEKPRPSRLRRSVRWCRRIGLFGLFLLLYAAVHLNQIGLPNFLKQPLLEQLSARGLTLDFSRLRVRLGRGLIAEHVTVDRVGEAAGEHFYADEIQIKLDWSPLKDFAPPLIRALLLRNGLVLIPVPAADNLPPYLFKVTDVSGLLVFLGPEEWELRSLEAACHGGQFRAFGSLTNASVLRRKRSKTNQSSLVWKRQLRRFGTALDHARFTNAPVLSVAFHADLLAPDQTTAEIEFRSESLSYDEHQFRGIIISAGLNQPPGTNGVLPASLRVEATHALTRWGEFKDLTLDASGDLSATNALPDLIDWSLRARELRSRWATASKVVARGHTLMTNAALASQINISARGALSLLTNAPGSIDHLELQLNGSHTWTNWSSGAGELAVTGVTSRWATVDAFSLHATAERAPQPVASAGTVGIWSSLGSVRIAASIASTNLEAHLPDRDLTVAVPLLSTHLDWNPAGGGQWTLSHFAAELPAGSVHLDATLQALSRQVAADFSGALDIQAYRPLLTPAAQHWLSQFGWGADRPPAFSGSIGITLPAWTNRHPDWRAEVVPTLSLQGHVAGSNFTFRNIPGDTAAGDFAYSNHVWRIPNMTATRPEGSIAFSYEGHDETHAYHFKLRSSLDPLIVRPLLEQDKLREALAEIALPLPPVLDGEVWGVWKEPLRTGVDVHVAATNVTFKGELIESVSGRVQFTNTTVHFTQVALRSQGDAWVPGGAFDAASQRLSFSNATATLDPLRVARIIGPKSARVMSNYLFAIPPATTIDGVIGVGTNKLGSDIRFTAIAPVFHWWRLGLTNATAALRFKGETLSLTGLKTDLHGGSATADLYFDWSQIEPGSVIRGDVTVTNIQLAGLMHSVVSQSNRIDGLLFGQAHFTGNTAHTNAWAGSGQVRLRDGFLWDVPMFGIFSQLFDVLSPGAGQTRFKEGQMNFSATNSVLTTRDLEVRSPTMRLSYKGTVDMASRLDARMEAELFRDAPVIGPILTLVLSPLTKLFIYDVKGTLKKPDAEPRYVPKLLLAPLRPFKTLRSLLPKDDPSEPVVAPPTLPRP